MLDYILISHKLEDFNANQEYCREEYKKRGVKNKLEREHHKKIILNFLCPFNKLIKCFMVLYWSLIKLQRIKSWPILPKIFTTLEKILKQKVYIEASVKDFNQKRRGRKEEEEKKITFTILSISCTMLLYEKQDFNKLCCIFLCHIYKRI